ncbi:MAG: peptidoglycan bridge formation glycyltransferase FemA/FemB family protein [Marmoricola sp.]|nr:peptidoglycan bridge formation glycyltransferase FemA/FemB family protein [Marmoricola sp.]
MTPEALTVRTITAEEHLELIRSMSRPAAGTPAGSASFLQTPAWAAVKPEWRAESIGWVSRGSTGNEHIVGAALVLYRRLPKVRRYLAYLPEGPLVEWDSEDLGRWLDPMAAHLRDQGAFGIRIGPPVVTRRWSAAQIKEGIADPSVATLTSLPPTERGQAGARVVSQLRELGWRQQSVEGGFAAGQPQYNFQIPLVDAEGNPRSEDEVLKGMNQQWRRNIKKATKLGVEVDRGEVSDLKAFHELYVHTAGRDHFTPRPLSYFETMFEALGAEEPDRIRLYLARHEGDLVASTIWIRVGTHAWYSYGASSTEKRDVRGSNAIQWQMIRDSLAAGAHIYDLRGITSTLDADDDHVGLIQFKVGTGGEAVELAGEWDLPLNRAIYKGFELYMKRRS